MSSLNTLRETRAARIAEMRGLTNAAQAANRDMDEGELEIGQIAGAVSQVMPAADILHELLADYQRVRQAAATHPRFGTPSPQP